MCYRHSDAASLFRQALSLHLPGQWEHARGHCTHPRRCLRPPPLPLPRLCRRSIFRYRMYWRVPGTFCDVRAVQRRHGRLCRPRRCLAGRLSLTAPPPTPQSLRLRRGDPLPCVHFTPTVLRMKMRRVRASSPCHLRAHVRHTSTRNNSPTPPTTSTTRRTFSYPTVPVRRRTSVSHALRILGSTSPTPEAAAPLAVAATGGKTCGTQPRHPFHAHGGHRGSSGSERILESSRQHRHFSLLLLLPRTMQALGHASTSRWPLRPVSCHPGGVRAHAPPPCRRPHGMSRWVGAAHEAASVLAAAAAAGMGVVKWVVAGDGARRPSVPARRRLILSRDFSSSARHSWISRSRYTSSRPP